jgi:hypothetical protein
MDREEMSRKNGTVLFFINVIVYFSTEIGLVLLKNDTGAFLWVTFHFVVNPLFSLILIVYYSVVLFKLKKTEFRVASSFRV